MNKKILILIVVLVAAISYAAYEYLKAKPPQFLINLVTAQNPAPPLPPGDTPNLEVPEGFSINIFAKDVPGARVMVRDQKGTLLLSLTKEGRIVALPDLDGNGVADTQVTVLSGLSLPHGMLVKCEYTGNESADQDSCVLYVAETGAVQKYKYDADTYTATFIETVVVLPAEGGHYTRTLLENIDGDILVSVGSSCNVCNEKELMRATVQAINPISNQVQTFATGLRNTVFMTLNPVTGEVWGTDNGRDLIGDDIPPDEINIISKGNDYGWPYCYGKNVRDDTFGNTSITCSGKTAAHIDLPAHAAALGIAFIPEEGWPEEWRHDILVALHGSWNRSEPAGYKVMRLDMDLNAEKEIGPRTDFITGFLPDGVDEKNSIGRPAGILVEPGGVVYVSDDKAGAIYRVTLD